MRPTPTTCVILSTKSSGSTALYRALTAAPGVSGVGWAPHQEHETLFWVHAASVLNLPLWDMPDSQVPSPPAVSSRVLALLAERNGIALEQLSTSDDIGALWRRLAGEVDVFVEKSPHHLAQRSALQLMLDLASRDERRWVFVALVRNPVDVLHSMWKRWRYMPEQHEIDLLESHRNLRWLRSRVDVVDVRYETLRGDAEHLTRQLGISGADLDSLRDGASPSYERFGYRPSDELTRLAQELGYDVRDQRRSPIWPLQARIQRDARVGRVALSRRVRSWQGAGSQRVAEVSRGGG